MSRNPKHSPPGSPQLSRRTPQLQYSTNSSESLYATQTPLPPLPPPTTTHNINGNLATHTNISLSSMDGAPTEVTSASKSSMLSCKNGATSRSAMSNSSSNNGPVVSKSLSKVAPSGEDLLKELKAPPLPPRKASNNNNNNSSNEINGLNHSSENITVLCEFDVPRTTAPPIPKHQTPPPITSRSSIDQITHEFQQHAAPQVPPPLSNHHTINDQDVETVIVGPAETISGIIDTRPISHRKPVLNPCGASEQQALTNNLYHMKNATSSPTMHVRNASLPVNNTSSRSTIHPSETLPKPAHPIPKPPIDLPPEIIRPQQRTSNEQQQPRPNSTPHSISIGSDHFLYENMTLNCSSTNSMTTTSGNSVSTTTTMMTTTTVQTPTTTNALSDATSVNTNHLLGKDCDNVPYENINLDYITRLMNEGYSKEHVITALGE